MNDNIIEKLVPPSMPFSEDEAYFNETDGLYYCKKCNTPLQMRIDPEDHIFTKAIYPNIRCACRQAEFDRIEAERVVKERMQEISRLKSSGLQDKDLFDCTFANDNGLNPKEMEVAHKFVVNWTEMKKNALGLLFWGNTGTGKTFTAGCIANALLEQGIPVLMATLESMLNELKGSHFSERNPYFDSLNQYELLIIDDLGAEPDTEGNREQSFMLFDSRYRSKKPMIVTTNLTLDELHKPKDLAHQRIYDRILERCNPLLINNCNMRDIKAAANLELAKNILKPNP